METSQNSLQKYSRLKHIVEAVDELALARGIAPQAAIDQLQPLLEDAKGFLSRMVTNLEERVSNQREDEKAAMCRLTVGYRKGINSSTDIPVSSFID
jgi:hypothetical protein